MPGILIFTATYNEAQNVSQWAEGVVGAVPDADILVINDSSPDGTGEVLEDLRSQIPKLEVVHRAGKSGLASAHLRAVDIALAGDYDMLVTMNADGSHQPNQVVDLLHAMDGADFIIGTRYRGGSHQAGTFRRILSLGANRLTMAV